MVMMVFAVVAMMRGVIVTLYVASAKKWMAPADTRVSVNAACVFEQLA